MQFSTITLLAALPVAFAQYGAADTTVKSGSASSTASSSGSVHTVTVGKDTLKFTPDSLTAKVGETIEFHFFPQRHTIARSDFASPCTPNNNTFFSGPFPTTSGENPNVFTITVNDTKPIWFYCGVPGHCQGGMAGVVNAPADGSKTIAQYQAAAKNVGTTLVPASVFGGVVGPAPAGSGTSSSTTTSTSSSPSSTQSNNAGVEARGSIKLSGLFAGVLAVGFGGFMI